MVIASPASVPVMNTIHNGTESAAWVILARMCRLKNRNVFRIPVAIALLVGMVGASADEEYEGDLHPFLTNGLSLDVGLYYPDRDLDLRVSSRLGPDNPEIDLDERLRLGRGDDIFSVELAWRIRGNWSVLGQYFDSSDSRTALLDNDIRWEDYVFQAGSNASMAVDFSVVRLFLGKQLDTRRRHDFGVGIGLHLLELGASIQGTAFINDQTLSARASIEEDGPLPNVGAWYRYSISPKWAFRSRLDLLEASVGDYSGLLINGSAGFNYRMFEHVGIGFAYNYFELDVDIKKNTGRANAEMNFDGLFVYLSGYFR